MKVCISLRHLSKSMKIKESVILRLDKTKGDDYGQMDTKGKKKTLINRTCDVCSWMLLMFHGLLHMQDNLISHYFLICSLQIYKWF